MKITLENRIRRLLKKAASIKDKVEPICSTQLNYPTKKNGYLMCPKCYPIQPERSKREDSQKCEMRCSEHCRNAVREVQ